jgi:hypothetical protein
MQKNRILAAAIASTLASTATAAHPAEEAKPYVGADLAEPLSDAELEAKIEAAKPTAPRITKEHIQSLIVDETYTNLEGTRTTVCRLELANGFCVVGINNGPVSAANFSQEIGCEYAYKAAVDQIWPLEGYLLAERLFRAATEDEKVNKLRDLVAVQTAPGNVDASEYHRGMANGLVLALSVFTGQEPQFHEAPTPGHQERVANERAELAGNIQRLGAFIGGGQEGKFGTLPEEEQQRLHRQHSAMFTYLAILDERIAAFPA